MARWGLYASMKVSQQAFEDPLFVAMLQAARGPHDTKGVVPKLTRKEHLLPLTSLQGSV
jgi:hypothetical protein